MKISRQYSNVGFARFCYRTIRDSYKVLRMSRELSKKTGKPLLFVARTGLQLFNDFGFTPKEIASNGIIESDSPIQMAKRKISKRNLVAIQSHLNPPELHPVTENKVAFEMMMRQKGVPIVPSLAVFFKGYGGFLKDGTLPLGRCQWLEKLEPILPEYFVVKPSSGAIGVGLKFYKKQENHLKCLVSGELLMLEALLERLNGDGYYSSYMFQPRLRNASDIQLVTGSNALETLRVITLLTTVGEPQILAAYWRLSGKGSFTDNFRLGQGGSLVCIVALDKGKVIKATARAPDGHYSTVHYHPVTNHPLDSIQLPEWGRIREIVHQAARVLIPIRTIGWDIAMTDQGPVVIEANARWDPPNHYDSLEWIIQRLKEESAQLGLSA